MSYSSVIYHFIINLLSSDIYKPNANLPTNQRKRKLFKKLP